MITIGTATSLPVEDTRAADTGGAISGDAAFASRIGSASLPPQCISRFSLR